MRVMCIDNTAKSHPDCVGNFTVKEDSGNNGWNSIYFIPLSDFDNNLLTLLNTKPKHKKFQK